MRRSLSCGEEDSTAGSTGEEGTGRIEEDPRGRASGWLCRPCAATPTGKKLMPN